MDIHRIMFSSLVWGIFVSNFKLKNTSDYTDSARSKNEIKRAGARSIKSFEDHMSDWPPLTIPSRNFLRPMTVTHQMTISGLR